MKSKPRQSKIKVSFMDILSDKTTNTWQLLSETDYFLSQTDLYCEYESQMRDLRARLNSISKLRKEKIVNEIQEEIVSIRKELRLLGYDVSLGKCRLVFDGFRHDDSIKEGFKRLVLYILDDSFLFLTGEANHIEIAEILDQQITRHIKATGRIINIKGKHYLWYLRTKNKLILSGAASESRENYEKLKAYGEASAILFLSRLKNLN